MFESLNNTNYLGLLKNTSSQEEIELYSLALFTGKIFFSAVNYEFLPHFYKGLTLG
jgi:hypothetical protein